MISVIGGSGFIGTRFCERLKNARVPFQIVDKNVSRLFPAETSVADVRQLSSLRAALGATSTIVNLAAEHRDDVRPIELYDEVNVQGARNICTVAREYDIKAIVFTSSVAVYGFAPPGTDERGQIAPFNDYGRTKAEAEKVFLSWQAEAPLQRSLTIIRPTVVFGERNRGNVYNLLQFIASGKFVMVGGGNNRKSMAYVENVAAFLEHVLSFGPGAQTYNYIDKPDFSMNELVATVRRSLGRDSTSLMRVPYWAGLSIGWGFDFLSALMRRRYAVSAIRVRKFCSDSVYDSRASTTGFTPPVALLDAVERTLHYEFLEHRAAADVFYTE